MWTWYDLPGMSPVERRVTARVLIVDDEPAMCEMLSSGLGSVGYDIVATTSAEEALNLLRAGDFDCLITDVRMGRADGIDLCREAVKARPTLPVIVITAFGTLRTAMEAIRAGAFDFVTKPFELDALRHVTRRAVQHGELTRRVRVLERSLRDLQSPQRMVGTSEPIRQLQRLVERAGPSHVGVLICGESGTGKELVARMVHEASPRHAHPFLAINCAALPESLLESELFGHVRGAFTDARTDKEGLFTQVGEGTLLLDEIGEMPLNLQPKLLRVLQQRQLRPVGGRTELPFRARILAATNRDLEEEVRAGRFREDLYYRIQVLQLDVPPLRVRGNDVLLLAQTFTMDLCQRLGRSPPRFSREFSDALLAYSWPGNVRELSNAIERALTLSDGEVLLLDDLPQRVRERGTASSTQADGSDELQPLEVVERRHILRVFEAVSGNKSLAARILGLNRKTLYRKLKEYGVATDESEPPP